VRVARARARRAVTFIFDLRVKHDFES
jgi:hypothetical protein